MFALSDIDYDEFVEISNFFERGWCVAYIEGFAFWVTKGTTYIFEEKVDEALTQVKKFVNKHRLKLIPKKQDFMPTESVAELWG